MLKSTKAPSLTIAPNQYSQQHFDVFNNVLRLYFNQVDTVTGKLLTDNGGGNLSFPHIAAEDRTDQYASGNNTPTIVRWSMLDSGSGFTLNANNTATPAYNGVYKIDYSLQFVNTDNQVHDVTVWLRINGVDVAGSASKFSLQARKSTGASSYMVAYSSVTFPVDAGQEIALWWATSQAYNVVGPVNGIYMEYEAAQTSPFAHPAVPSAIGSIVFVSAPTA